MSQQARPLVSLSVVSTAAIAQYRGVTYAGAQVAAANAKCIGIAERPTSTPYIVGEVMSVTSKGTAIAESGGASVVGSALAFDGSGRVVQASAFAIASPTVAVGSLVITTGAVAVTGSTASGPISGAPSVTMGALSGGDLPQYIVGYALQAAAGTSEFIEILLN